MLFATIGPISFIPLNVSKSAFAKFSKDLNFFAKTFAAFVPTCLIPSAVISLYNSLFLLFSIAFVRFSANFLPFFLSDAISSKLSLYISAILLIKSLFISWSIMFSPRPSMFIASLDTKCTKFLYSLAGHSIPVHLIAASPSSLTVGAPQTGHTEGISKSFSSPVLLFLITSTISGITSPAF